MKIVNGHLAHSIEEQGMLKEPNSFGYVLMAAEVELPRLFLSNSAEKTALLDELKLLSTELKSSSEFIRRVDVFDAFIIPPGSKEGRELIEERNYDVHIAKFDVVVLVECTNIEDALEVRRSQELTTIENLLTLRSTHSIVTACKNASRIDEVDKDSDGVFLFNFFFSEDAKTLLDVWHYTAGWWTEKAHLTNSTPLEPVTDGGSQYQLINHCRWDKLADVVPSLIFKPSLRSFVLKNFTENDIVAMPILYRLA